VSNRMPDCAFGHPAPRTGEPVTPCMRTRVATWAGTADCSSRFLNSARPDACAVDPTLPPAGTRKPASELLRNLGPSSAVDGWELIAQSGRRGRLSFHAPPVPQVNTRSSIEDRRRSYAGNRGSFEGNHAVIGTSTTTTGDVTAVANARGCHAYARNPGGPGLAAAARRPVASQVRRRRRAGRQPLLATKQARRGCSGCRGGPGQALAACRPLVSCAGNSRNISAERGQDLLGALLPHERLGVGVPRLDPLTDVLL
jgi:hypothetical protein